MVICNCTGCLGEESNYSRWTVRRHENHSLASREQIEQAHIDRTGVRPDDEDESNSSSSMCSDDEEFDRNGDEPHEDDPHDHDALDDHIDWENDPFWARVEPHVQQLLSGI